MACVIVGFFWYFNREGGFTVIGFREVSRVRYVCQAR